MSNLIQFPADRWQPDYSELADLILRIVNTGITIEETHAICINYGYPPSAIEAALRKILKR